jgi:hypothetical protein
MKFICIKIKYKKSKNNCAMPVSYKIRLKMLCFLMQMSCGIETAT